MSSPNTPCLCQLITTNPNIQEDQREFFFSTFKKIKFKIYIYLHIFSAKKLFNIVICSVKIVCFEITSVNTSSTLN